MAACSEVVGEVRARALYGHRTAALTARVMILILALLLALVLISPSRAADDGIADEPMLPFTIGGGLTVAALGALVLVVRRIQDLRAEKRRLEERVEQLSDHNWELKEAEERARSFLAAQGDLIVRRDGDGCITYVNDAFCALAGKPRETLAGSAFALDVIEDGGAAMLPDGTRVCDQKIATAEGPRWIAWREVTVRTAGGSETQSVGRDVTDRVEAEHALGEARRFATSLADELHRAEVRFTELSGRRASIRERLETEWRRPLGELLRTAESLNLGDAALRAEADTLREQLEHLGPVNTLAIEEHDETARRLDFLAAQRADLSDARSALQQAIREIDTTARDLFMTTFTRIRENFQQTFRTLFDGGECDLRLEQPETPLDCDIEIHASPRGKRSQRIYLLSGGERALVALALLFGIFLTKPSPFCLLDEVDAPLDDANVGRFVRLLTEFKQRTQFIVITHNPRTTTEAADAVYGVTMQEPGVSSLVSVRMKGASVDNGVTREAEEAIATA
jgi:DNA repair exonuclease SbcCD ATPase subunit